MSKPLPDSPTLWQRLIDAGRVAQGRLWASGEGVEFADLATKSALSVDPEILRGRSVMVATAEQLPAALALIELDGVARRLVLCPPGVSAQHLPGIIEDAEVDAILGDPAKLQLEDAFIDRFVVGRPKAPSSIPARQRSEETEWILMTSGTTGTPKLVGHTLATLTGAITASPTAADTVWSTFYDIRRYGGLQIFLRAVRSGSSMVLSDGREPVADFLSRAGACGVTHISGTPSHWRRATMSSARHRVAPRYVRLSGEIADQSILDHLHAVYADADIAHAFASTEAGVAFDVGDGFAGFPACMVEGNSGNVELRVTAGSLRIRSNRMAFGYLRRGEIVRLSDPEGFVDTGDMVERRGDRYYFTGRRDGVINVGGQKVYPEEVEAVINRHPGVAISVVKSRPSPILGAIVVAQIIVTPEIGEREQDRRALEGSILRACRQALPAHKVPSLVRFVASLPLSAAGKLSRADA